MGPPSRSCRCSRLRKSGQSGRVYRLGNKQTQGNLHGQARRHFFDNGKAAHRQSEQLARGTIARRRSERSRFRLVRDRSSLWPGIESLRFAVIPVVNGLQYGTPSDATGKMTAFAAFPTLSQIQRFKCVNRRSTSDRLSEIVIIPIWPSRDRLLLR